MTTTKSQIITQQVENTLRLYERYDDLRAIKRSGQSATQFADGADADVELRQAREQLAAVLASLFSGRDSSSSGG